MELELLNFFSVDLKWTSLKKGRRSMTRRPRNPVSENKRQDLTTFETNKVVDAPLKKRKLLQQSLPAPKIPFLHGDRGMPAGPQTPSVNHEDPSQRSHSNTISQSQKTKSKTRLRNNKQGISSKLSKYDDFSGIELLADAACSSLIHDNADHVNDEKVLKEETIVKGGESTKSDGSSNQDILVLDSQNLQDDGNQKAAPAKGLLRLHWDLNTVMDEWEEPSLAEGVSVNDAPVSSAAVKTCEYSFSKKTSEEDVGTKTVTSSSKPSDCESSCVISKSDVADKCEDFSTSTVIVKEGGESIGSEEDPPTECCGSNVTQDEKIQAGYDSPFEDGEFREPTGWNESCNTHHKHDFGTVENPLSVKVNHGQTMEEDMSSLPMPNNAIVEKVTLEIPLHSSQLDMEERDCVSGKESSGRKNVPCVPQSSRSSNMVRAYEHYRPKNMNTNYYASSGGGYRPQSRRPSSSLERNNIGYGGDNHHQRAPPPTTNRYTFHSQQEHHDYYNYYGERKLGCYSPKRGSRSGSPIAWHFQKQKNLDSSQRSSHLVVDDVSPERGVFKRYDERRRIRSTEAQQFRDKRESMMIRRIGRLTSDDDHHIRFSSSQQQSGRFSTHRYKENGGYTRN